MKRRREITVVGLFVAVVTLAGQETKAAVVFDKSEPAPYQFAERFPHWTWGAMVGAEGNRTAAPRIISASPGQGPETKFLTIPDAAAIVVESSSRTPEGGLAVCGAAYDTTGKAAGFLALLGPREATFKVVRLYPYFPYSLAVASDGSIWTSGDEMIDSNPHAPSISPKLKTLRHFDASGKLLEGFVPRDTLKSKFSASYGYVEAAAGRIGWYTGPFTGPGSVYYEVSNDGRLTTYPGVDLHENERVTGIALAANGRAYATTFEKKMGVPGGTPHFFSIGPGETAWKSEVLSQELADNPSLHLYGANGNQLILWRNFSGASIITARAQ